MLQIRSHSTAQHITAQHSTSQHSTAQHSTAQHATAQHMHSIDAQAALKRGLCSATEICALRVADDK